MKYYMNVYSNIRTPYVTTLCNRNGKTLKVLEDNQALVAKLNGQHLGTREFFQFTTGEGIQLNGYMVKPADFNPGKKYPSSCSSTAVPVRNKSSTLGEPAAWAVPCMNNTWHNKASSVSA